LILLEEFALWRKQKPAVAIPDLSRRLE